MWNHVNDLTDDELTRFARIVSRLEGSRPGDDTRSEVLDDLARVMRAEAVVSFVWQEKSGGKYMRPRYRNVTDDIIKRYESELQFRDPWYQMVERLPSPTPLDRILTTSQFEESEIYNNVLAPDGLYHCLGLYLRAGEQRIGRVTVLRTREGGAFDDREINLFRALKPYLCRSITRTEGRGDNLTEREREIVSLVSRGCTDRNIAEILSIGFYTVRTHIGRALAKTGCSNRAELAVFFSLGHD